MKMERRRQAETHFEKGCTYMIEMQSDITYMPVPLPHPSQRVLGKPQAVITKMT
jgi:hypothetical protein